MNSPLEKKYVYIKESGNFDSAGEGTYASRHIPENITFALYNGYLYNEEQNALKNKRIVEKSISNNWLKDEPLQEKEWLYK